MQNFVIDFVIEEENVPFEEHDLPTIDKTNLEHFLKILSLSKYARSEKTVHFDAEKHWTRYQCNHNNYI